MAQEGPKNVQGSAATESKPRGESVRDKVLATVLGFLLTGVIGGMVGAWFQERGWAWQNRVAQVEKDTRSALDSLHSASELLDKRWSAALQMLQAVQDTKASDESRAAAAERFRSVNDEWQLGYANIDAAIQFTVDRPFFRETKPTPQALYSLPCDAFPFDSVDPGSALVILKVINHCHDLLKTDIEQLGKAPIDAAGRKALIHQASVRLDHLYHMNDALRCVILERAISMRRSLDTELDLGSMFRVGTRDYAVPREEGECVGRYRAWAESIKARTAVASKP
jgi:hypothetical protein